MKIINLVEDTAGNPLCEHEHGLSFYIETKTHKLLVDSGATDMFIRNAEVLGVDLKQVDSLILSHGHYDHSGGILSFTELNKNAKIYAQSTVDKEYYNLTDNKEKYIGINKRIVQLPQFVSVDGNLKIDEELFLFSGVKGNKYPSKGNLHLKQKENGRFIQDGFEHEQCLVIIDGEKHILLSGCAHNGIANILDRYKELFQDEPDVVISGFHLMQKQPYSEEEISNIKKMSIELKNTKSIYYTGHCTGGEAYLIMKEIMGDQLQWIHSGEVVFEED